jgi:hypothetical protein
VKSGFVFFPKTKEVFFQYRCVGKVFFQKLFASFESIRGFTTTASGYIDEDSVETYRAVYAVVMILNTGTIVRITNTGELDGLENNDAFARQLARLTKTSFFPGVHGGIAYYERPLGTDEYTVVHRAFYSPCLETVLEWWLPLPMYLLLSFLF